MTREQDWVNYLIYGTKLPEIDWPDVPQPKGIYVCRFCGRTNNNFEWECETCEDPNGEDHDDD